ncbi:MAG: GntR family transcriptional regulator [Hyphomicrobium sp.]|nr:GntR family transcriptional regulator [Hyphomicrobium sp.]
MKVMESNRLAADSDKAGLATEPADSPLVGFGVPAHEGVYRQLRELILFGGIRPGSALTLRGIADDLGVSPMPVREAVRRLIAERALAMQDNRRVRVAPMTAEKFEQILFARRAIEPELAVRALANLDPSKIAEIEAIDEDVNRAMFEGDTEGYMRANYYFHFALYRHADAPTLLGLVDSIWLQFGPFMRMAYGRIGTSRIEDIEDNHAQALAAIRTGDGAALRTAIDADIGQGMRYIGEAVLSPRA